MKASAQRPHKSKACKVDFVIAPAKDAASSENPASEFSTSCHCSLAVFSSRWRCLCQKALQLLPWCARHVIVLEQQGS